MSIPDKHDHYSFDVRATAIMLSECVFDFAKLSINKMHFVMTAESWHNDKIFYDTDMGAIRAMQNSIRRAPIGRKYTDEHASGTAIATRTFNFQKHRCGDTTIIGEL